MHLLLIEDDPLVAHGVAAGLRLHGFAVEHCGSARCAEGMVQAATFDAAVLDLGLPDEDGMQLLARWRGRGLSLPVLVLTARDALAHRVAGLKAGADDYLLKPFELDELVARLQALLRRVAGRASDWVQHGPLAFDAGSGEARLHGEPVALSRRELALLRALLQRPQQILSAEQLCDSLYGFGQEVESNALNVHIHHLRRKLGAGIVETVRGRGFRLGSAG